MQKKLKSNCLKRSKAAAEIQKMESPNRICHPEVCMLDVTPVQIQTQRLQKLYLTPNPDMQR